MRRLGLVPLVVLLCGCGGGTGELSGRVLFKGEPLHEGTVTVVGPDNIPRQAGIEAGAYHVPNLPVGEAKILVIAPDSLPDPQWPEAQAHTRRTEEGKTPPKLAPQAKGPPRKLQPVRHIYATLDATPLKVTIKPGSNNHDIAVD